MNEVYKTSDLRDLNIFNKLVSFVYDNNIENITGILMSDMNKANHQGTDILLSNSALESISDEVTDVTFSHSSISLQCVIQGDKIDIEFIALAEKYLVRDVCDCIAKFAIKALEQVHGTDEPSPPLLTLNNMGAHTASVGDYAKLLTSQDPDLKLQRILTVDGHTVVQSFMENNICVGKIFANLEAHGMMERLPDLLKAANKHRADYEMFGASGYVSTSFYQVSENKVKLFCFKVKEALDPTHEVIEFGLDRLIVRDDKSKEIIAVIEFPFDDNIKMFEPVPQPTITKGEIVVHVDPINDNSWALLDNIRQFSKSLLSV